MVQKNEFLYLEQGVSLFAISCLKASYTHKQTWVPSCIKNCHIQSLSVFTPTPELGHIMATSKERNSFAYWRLTRFKKTLQAFSKKPGSAWVENFKVCLSISLLSKTIALYFEMFSFGTFKYRILKTYGYLKSFLSFCHCMSASLNTSFTQQRSKWSKGFIQYILLKICL